MPTKAKKQRSAAKKAGETPDQRSRIMRAVKSFDTGPEKIIRRLVHSMGFRFRLNRRDLPGKPDLVFPRFRKVIFVHGCFWHGHDCLRGARLPKNNAEYWRAKIARNALRDKENIISLRKLGWRSAVVWECALKDPARIRARLARFLQ